MSHNTAYSNVHWKCTWLWNPRKWHCIVCCTHRLALPFAADITHWKYTVHWVTTLLMTQYEFCLITNPTLLLWTWAYCSSHLPPRASLSCSFQQFHSHFPYASRSWKNSWQWLWTGCTKCSWGGIPWQNEWWGQTSRNWIINLSVFIRNILYNAK